MDSNPALGFLGFWMMMQLVATLALLIGGIYVLFCLGRAASGLDRMANAMEDWIALQNPGAQNAAPQTPASRFDLGAPSAPTGAPSMIPFTPAASTVQSHPEHSVSDESSR